MKGHFMNPLCCVFFLVHHKFDPVTNDLNYNISQYANWISVAFPAPMPCHVMSFPRTRNSCAGADAML